MSTRLHPTPAVVAMIGRFEGYVGHPYQDGAGVWTIGYGHTEGVGPHSKHLTQTQAEALLRRDLAEHYAPPINDLHLPLSQAQFDATLSFVFNLGPGVLRADHDFGRALRARRWRAAAEAMMEYDKDIHGAAEPGLRTRRARERALFLEGTK